MQCFGIEPTTGQEMWETGIFSFFIFNERISVSSQNFGMCHQDKISERRRL